MDSSNVRLHQYYIHIEKCCSNDQLMMALLYTMDQSWVDWEVVPVCVELEKCKYLKICMNWSHAIVLKSIGVFRKESVDQYMSVEGFLSKSIFGSNEL